MIIRAIQRPLMMPFLVDWSTPEEIVAFYAEYGVEATVTPLPESPEGRLLVESSRVAMTVLPGEGFNLDGAPWEPAQYQAVPADVVEFVVSEPDIP